MHVLLLSIWFGEHGETIEVKKGVEVCGKLIERETIYLAFCMNDPYLRDDECQTVSLGFKLVRAS